MSVIHKIKSGCSCPQRRKDRQRIGCPGKLVLFQVLSPSALAQAKPLVWIVWLPAPQLTLSPACAPALCSALGRETPGARGPCRPHWTLGWELISVLDLSLRPQGRAGSPAAQPLIAWTPSRPGGDLRRGHPSGRRGERVRKTESSVTRP